MHSGDVRLRNDIIEALCAHDANAMRKAIDRLRADFPDDASTDDFEHLFFELSALNQRGRSAPAIAQQVERIGVQLLPPLRKMVGVEAAQRWIRPVYGDLARAACGQAFSRDLANAHAAGLFLRAGELAMARSAVAEISSWRRIPEPLAWMAEIALRESISAEFWPLLAELAWIAPALLDDLLADLPAHGASVLVFRLYREFSAEADIDSENDEAAWFPAWLLVEHSELLPFLRTAHPHNSGPARSAALLIDLLIGERQGTLPSLVEKRKQLRDLAPVLFRRYMAQR
jgi:hypothetical protein